MIATAQPNDLVTLEMWEVHLTCGHGYLNIFLKLWNTEATKRKSQEMAASVWSLAYWLLLKKKKAPYLPWLQGPLADSICYLQVVQLSSCIRTWKAAAKGKLPEPQLESQFVCLLFKIPTIHF